MTNTPGTRLSVEQIGAVARWTREFHYAVAGFSHPGPWRFFPVIGPTLIGHNDIAPYNVCFDGAETAGRRREYRGGAGTAGVVDNYCDDACRCD